MGLMTPFRFGISLIFAACATHAGDNDIAFGNNASWIAFRNSSPESVVDVLQLSEVRRTSWNDGVRESVYRMEKSNSPAPSATGKALPEAFAQWFGYPYSDQVFVFRADNEWTIATGQRLTFMRSFIFKGIPRDREPDKLLPFIRELSRRSDTSVQFYSTFSIPETHIWVKADRGKIVRAYGFSGESGAVWFNEGALQPAERKIRNKLPPNTDLVLSDTYPDFPEIDDVLELSRQWSVSPEVLAERANPPSGFIGTLTQ